MFNSLSGRGKAQKGFTLIEMSIVLVIIGLIVGGILKGQEIVENSRQKNALAEVERIRAAVNTFVDRYRALPGDFALAQGAAGVGRITTSALVINGDGDGIVEPVAAAATAAGIVGVNGGIAGAAGTGETVSFFTQLSAADLIGGVTLSAAAQTAFGEGAALPAGPFPGTGFTIAYGSYDNLAGYELASHWLRLSKGPPTAITAGLTAKQMQSLDVRIDDGVAATGQFRSGGLAAPCGTAVATPDYQATVETVSCIALVSLVQ